MLERKKNENMGKEIEELVERKKNEKMGKETEELLDLLDADRKSVV